MKSRLPADPSRRQRLRVLWLVAGLWTALVIACAALVAADRVREHRAQILQTSTVRLSGVRDALNLTFRQLAALPRNLASRPSVLEFLTRHKVPDTSAMSEAERNRVRDAQLADPAVQQMNALLDRTVEDFGLQLVILIDANGTTLANGIADKRGLPSSVGSSLKTREYFEGAMKDGSSSQFLLGRSSRVPGFYFAHRIDLDHKTIGVAVIKQDTESLNRLLSDSESSLVLVTDAYGVVVLGNRANLLLQRMPDASVQTPKDWQSIYQRVPDTLRWTIASTRIGNQEAMTAEWRNIRHLAIAAPLGDRPFKVWIFSPLDTEVGVITNALGIAAGIWLLGCVFIWLGWRRVELVNTALQARRELLDMANALPLTVFRYHQPPSGPGRFSFIGRGVRELFGVEKTTLENDPVLPWRLAMHQSAPPTQPTEFPVRQDDRTVWVLAHSTPFPQGDGGMVYNGYWLDISARREAELRFAALFEHAPTGYLFFDRKRGVTHCNPASLSLFGISDPKGMLGRHVWFAGLSPPMQPDGQPSRTKALAQMEQHMKSHQRVQNTEWRFRRIDGSTFDADVTIVALDWEGEPQFCAVVRDITAHKQSEEAMQQARATAEAASQTKSTFLANMSHELRTPMNAIIGMTHLALEDGLPPRQRDFVEKAHDSARNLLQILNDILDVSKIEAGHMDIEQVEFDLEAVVGEMADVLGLKADEKGLQLLFSAGPGLPTRLVGDPTRLRQVLVNLGSNAIKFTDSGEVLVRLELSDDDAQGLELHCFVRDTGMGLSTEQLSRLFQPFMQADSSTTRRYGGTGLGLVICRQLVEKMGGRLWVDSEPGRGSTFHFTARFGRSETLGEVQGLLAKMLESQGQPVLAQRTGNRASAPRQRAAMPVVSEKIKQRLAGARILLVEDHPLNQELAAELLRRASMEVVLAENGKDALTKLATEGPFDGVLMDCQMPVMDGYTATRRLRADPAHTKLPVIAMTASALSEDRDRALASGMNAHIAKPLNVAQMLATMAEWISSRRTVPSTVEAGPATDWAPLPSEGPIDTEDGLARCMGKAHLYRRILTGFRDANHDYTSQVARAYADGHWDDAVRRTHDLKGLAGTIGAHGLHNSSQALQAALASRDRLAVSDLLPRVKADLASVLSEIARLVPNE
ncbi:ATP-binding protein [Piscinibacter terrae]|uniref:Sensory/regulatory protein RpfC n=1 Tax=Piscinibacter terrae TaxID=2496871 RepID=A0A3N7HWB5_9BURK|nr:ATP-binding protein [Albitalea terrae]RQP25696.1 response regulator [Albitalea terrae]